jgi:hypothetical protein
MSDLGTLPLSFLSKISPYPLPRFFVPPLISDTPVHVPSARLLLTFFLDSMASFPLPRLCLLA